MTALYKPVLIESAEQAEALPLGAIVRRGRLQPLELWHDTYTGELSWGDEDLDPEDLVGRTALVPIEAEEETIWSGSRYLYTQRRLVTPWEEA